MGIIKNVVNYLPIATNISGNVTKSECVNSLFKGFNIIGVILIVRMVFWLVKGFFRIWDCLRVV